MDHIYRLLFASCSFILMASLAVMGQAFEKELLYPGVSRPTRVQKAMDVDLDGDIDFIDAYSGFGNTLVSDDSLVIRWWANDGSGNFSDPVLFPATSGKFVRLFDVADINQDGRTDLIYSGKGPSANSSRLFVCYQNAGSGFGVPQVLIPNEGLLSRFEHFQDINGDGFPDFFSKHYYRFNLTNGTFGPAVSFNSPTSPAADLYDMDGDGLKDLIYSSDNWPTPSSSLFWSKQLSPGTFGASQLITDTLKIIKNVKAYRDSTTQKIFLAVNLSPPNPSSPEKSYMIQKDGSTYSIVGGLHPYPGTGFTRITTVTGVEFLVNQFGEEVRRCNCSNSLYPPQLPYFETTYQTRFHGKWPPLYADLNGDGKKDHIVDGRVWYRYDGQHRFFYGGVLDTQPMNTERLTEVDVDGDGIRDLVNIEVGHMTYFRGLPNDSFESPRQLAFHPRIQSSLFSGKVEAMDFNQDGKRDLVFFDTWSGKLMVLQGLGQGQFEPQPRFLPLWLSSPGSNYLSRFQAQEINGDAFPDAVVHYQNKLYAARNNGGNQFTNFQVLINDSIAGIPVVFADIDLDGKADVVAYHRNRVSWYKRLTTSTFSTRKPITNSISIPPSWTSDAGGLVVRDMDNDGDPDVVFFAGHEQKTYVFHNQGNGVFDPGPVSPQLGTNLAYFYVEDLAGDGYPDAVTDPSNWNQGAFWSNLTPGGFRPNTQLISGQYRFTLPLSRLGSPRIDIISDSGNVVLYRFRNQLDQVRTLSGRIFPKTLPSCQDPGGNGLENILVRCKPGGYLASTDALGRFDFQVPPGQYEIEPIITQGSGLFLDSLCPAFSQTALVDSSGSGLVVFGAQLKNCPFLQVSVLSPRRRRCARNFAQASVTNSGQATAYAIRVKISLPRYVSMVSPGNIWTWNAGDSTWTTRVDSLTAGKSLTLPWVDSVHCVDGIMGQWQCTRVWLEPGNEGCLPTLPGWDQSIIRIRARCTSGSGHVYLKNTGPGAMSAPRNFRVYQGPQLLVELPYQLASGDSLLVEPALPGRRLEADQGEANPFGKWVSSLVLDCGNATYSGSPVASTQYASFGDESEACAVIRDSYDPNEKVAIPSASEAENFVRSGSTLAYTLHFQNMGNDTAFRVLVADTLSRDLDPASLQITGSSHPFRLQIKGNESRTALHFVFDPIALTDTFTNKEKSMGFVSFTLRMKPGLPQGRVIENKASIYFDQNSAIVTNTTRHTVKDHYLVSGRGKEMYPPQHLLILPNPNSGKFRVEVGEVRPGGTLEVFTLQGKRVKSIGLTQEREIQMDLENQLPAGVYLVKLMDLGGEARMGRLVIQ